MIEPWGRYAKKWTELSLKELKNFARWMNDILGYHPTIIGGWAVYLYNPGMGSIDIDTVLPTREIRDRVINTYLKSNGYELRERAFGESEWVKLLEPGNPESETYLDVCTLQDKNIVHGKDIKIPWSIAIEWQRSIKIDDVEIYIPEPEPLLVLKVKAAWDRSYDIEKIGGSPFLKDKFKKDRLDILSLLSKCELNQDIINKIILKYKFKECFEDTLSRTISDRKTLKIFGYRDEEIANLNKKITKILSSKK